MVLNFKSVLIVKELVLIAEENSPPLFWKLGRIASLYDGNDAINRVAKVKTATGELISSIHKLRKLLINPTEPPILPEQPIADS